MTEQRTNTVIDHDNASAFLPAGPFMAGRPLPAMNHRLDAGGAVSPAGPQRQRRRRVSALTGCRRWRSRLH